MEPSFWSDWLLLVAPLLALACLLGAGTVVLAGLACLLGRRRGHRGRRGP